MTTKELEFPLSKVKEAVRPWLFLEDEGIIDVMCATVIANQFRTDPLWMILIGPPSHAKTELLRALDGHPSAYFLSNLTPATLVSGKPKKGPDPSLLPKLNDKTLVMKDFTTILTMRSEKPGRGAFPVPGDLRRIIFKVFRHREGVSLERPCRIDCGLHPRL
jgi:hypothetical protein